MSEKRREHLNEYFEILKNERRRVAIRMLAELDRVSVSELSEGVAAVEYGKESEELTSDEKKRVYTSMSQVHLPKLEDCGVVSIERDEIEPKGKNDELAQYIRELEGSQKPVLRWLFAFALSSVVLATSTSVLFFWVGVERSGEFLPATIVLMTATTVVLSYTAYSRVVETGGARAAVSRLIGECGE
jgi:DNA-binding transcriptional ArsR family regulator